MRKNTLLTTPHSPVNLIIDITMSLLQESHIYIFQPDKLFLPSSYPSSHLHSGIPPVTSSEDKEI